MIGKKSHEKSEKQETATEPAKEAEEKKQDASNRELEELKAKVQELEGLKERMLRRAADFENAKKRLHREREEFLNFAHEQVLVQILPIVDNLDRALESARKTQAPQGVFDGIELIHRQLLDLLARFDVKPIEVVGKIFDPHFHEAAGHVESEMAEGTIVSQVRRGYVFKHKLLRPALVTTAVPKGKAETQAPSASSSGEESDEN